MIQQLISKLSLTRFLSATAAVITILAIFGGVTLLQAQEGGNGYISRLGNIYKNAPSALTPHYLFAYEGEKLLKSGIVDEEASQVTLPLYEGRMNDGRTVWYVITDVSNKAMADTLGINFSAKLNNVSGNAVRTATVGADGMFIFDQGTVDFSPERIVVPGEAPNFFPPAQVQAGSKGDEFYTPIVRVTNAGNMVYNATVVAFDVAANEIEFPNGNVDYGKVIDRAAAISPQNGTVTFSLNVGTSDGRPILFMSLDSNDNLVSALEGTTWAPALGDIMVGMNDRPNSAVSANYIIANGPTGEDNPQKQGLNSALSDGNGEVLDIFDAVPGHDSGHTYSPMWDLYVAEWTSEAIENGFTSAIYSELQFLGLAEQGWVTGPGGAEIGPSGLVSNCPLVMRY